MKRSNFPTNQINSVPAEFAHDTIKSLNELNSLGRPENDDDVELRINEYFAFCEHSSIRPGVESLGLALSVSRTAIWNWEHGIDCSRRRQELIIKAKALINSFIEQALLSNKVYPGSGIFLLKNWAGYTDNVQIEAKDTTLQLPDQAAADIAARHRIGQAERPELPPELREEIDALPD